MSCWDSKRWVILKQIVDIYVIIICFSNIFVFQIIISIFDPTNQIFLPEGCLVFIKKGEEIRLYETLATNPAILENGAKT